MHTSPLPHIIIAGLSGGTGKTIASLGLTRALVKRGDRVRAFKKGPDYIDAAWLSLASSNICYNLDPFFLTEERLRSLFFDKAQGFDISITEGNRGLFDGMDEHGTCSTSALARQLNAPVILAIDCTKMTRTVAALVQGCTQFEPDLNLAGVILNRTAGERHRSILQRSIETHTDIPVLGMLPKFRANPIPERHMGLVPDYEYASDGYSDGEKALDSLAEHIGEWVDVDRVREIAFTTPSFTPEPLPLWDNPAPAPSVRVGFVRDAALWFYYEENFEALQQAGAELIELSILSDAPWPEIDALYLGGGFPETWAEQISENSTIREHIKNLADKKLPIYAECGGFMLLCEKLEYKGATYPMCGVLPATTIFRPKPQGLGYTKGTIVSENPFYPVGTKLIGHEFHYSHCVPNENISFSPALQFEKGTGALAGFDGIVMENVFAGYNHISALAVEEWATGIVEAAKKYQNLARCTPA